MPGPLVQALIAHLDNVFEGPNGDYSAGLEAAGRFFIQAVTREQLRDDGTILVAKDQESGAPSVRVAEQW